MIWDNDYELRKDDMMSLFEQWQNRANEEMSQQEYQAFWASYFEEEKENYALILENNDPQLKGTIKELADKFDMDAVTFVGFLDGINTSLTEELDLEKLDEASEIDAMIDFEKLLFNMHDAKADWLYGLPQWDHVLPLERRKEIRKEYGRSTMASSEKKAGRNDPCPCGSGKKYKKCCLKK